MRTAKATLQARFLTPFHGIANAATDQAPTAGRVLLMMFEVQNTCIADAIIINNGTVVAGNVTVGIYGPVVTEDTCVGSTVIAQSASTAVAGTSQPQIISFSSATQLNPGRYYAAIEYSDSATMKYFRLQNAEQVTGFGQYYDRGGGYGALTATCPAITGSGSAMPGCHIRCS
jgi:hypothetical protein